MSDIESYLWCIKNNFLKRTSTYCLIYFLVCVVPFSIAFMVPKFVSCSGAYYILDPISKGNASLAIKSILSSQIPLTLQLVILLCSVFTLCNKYITAILVSWRSISLGAAISFVNEGYVLGGSISPLAFSGYFVATLLFIILASVASVYSEAISHTLLSGSRRFTVSLAAEMIKYYLILSGGIFILGCISVISI